MDALVGILATQAVVLPTLVKFLPALMGNLPAQVAVLPTLVVFYTYMVKQNTGFLCNMVLLESDN